MKKDKIEKEIQLLSNMELDENTKLFSLEDDKDSINNQITDNDEEIINLKNGIRKNQRKVYALKVICNSILVIGLITSGVLAFNKPFIDGSGITLFNYAIMCLGSVVSVICYKTTKNSLDGIVTLNMDLIDEDEKALEEIKEENRRLKMDLTKVDAKINNQRILVSEIDSRLHSLESRLDLCNRNFVKFPKNREMKLTLEKKTV